MPIDCPMSSDLYVIIASVVSHSNPGSTQAPKKLVDTVKKSPDSARENSIQNTEYRIQYTVYSIQNTVYSKELTRHCRNKVYLDTNCATP